MSGSNQIFTNWNNVQSDLGNAVSVTGAGSGQIINNSNGLIYGRGGNPGIFNQGSISLLSNDGSIGSATSLGIANAGGSITQLINTGTIAGGGGISAIDNSSGTITRLSNNGDITGSAPNGVGLYNVNSGGATITTLDNGQGGNGASASTTALTMRGKLPANYNIIVTSPTHYGQLSVISNISGTTTFGIYGGGVAGISASTLAAGTYSSVLSGLSLSNLVGATSGSYGAYNWSLINSSGSNWNLIVTGTSSGSSSSSGSLSMTTSQTSTPAPYSLTSYYGNYLSDIINRSPPVNQIIFTNGSYLLTDFVGSTFTTYSPITLTNTTVYSAPINGFSFAAPFERTTLVVPKGKTINFAGPLSGSGTILIEGGGTVTFSGNSPDFSGKIIVLNGTLNIENSNPIGTGAVEVSKYGTLTGTGLLHGSFVVTAGGVIKPGNSPGYMDVGGSLSLKSGSAYRQDIAGATQASLLVPKGSSGYYSFMNIGGALSIDAGSVLALQLQNLFTVNEPGYGSAPYIPRLGDQFRMLTAAGGITGRFTTLTQPEVLAAGTQFVSFYNMNNSNSLDLAVIPSSYPTTIASASGNKNAQAVGAALDKIAQANVTGISTSAQDSLLYAISGQTSATGIASYAQSLAGEVYAAAVAVIAQTTQRVQQAVLTRLGDTMGISLPNAMTSSVGNTALMHTTNTALSGGVNSSAVISNPAVDLAIESSVLSKGNVWGDIAYQKGNRSSDSNSGGWNTNLYQLVFGSDFYADNGVRLGGGIALSNTTLNPTYGSGTIQQGSVFAYGKMPIEEYVVDAMASFGLNNSDLSRSDVTNLSNGFRNKSISGNDALLSLGLSRPIDTESLRITPYARVTWQMVMQSGVSEGDTASALSVNSFSGNGVRGVLGVALGSKANNPMTETYTYRVYAGVGTDSSGLLNPVMNASLAGMSTKITTPNLGSTFVQAGLYGTAKVSENAYAYAGLSGEARSGQTLGAINVGLRLQF